MLVGIALFTLCYNNSVSSFLHALYIQISSVPTQTTPLPAQRDVGALAPLGFGPFFPPRRLDLGVCVAQQLAVRGEVCGVALVVDRPDEFEWVALVRRVDHNLPPRSNAGSKRGDGAFFR